jgi:hypothetical protein
MAVLAAALFASTGVARANAPVNVFSGAGVFIDNPMDFADAPTLAGELQAAHFTWVAFHVDDVGTLDWTPRAGSPSCAPTGSRWVRGAPRA